MSNRSRSGSRGRRPSAFRFATSAERRAMQEGNPMPFHVVGAGGGHPAVVVSGMHMPRAFAPAAAGAVHTGFHFAPAAAGTPFAGLAGPMGPAPVPMAPMAAAVANRRVVNRRTANRRTAKRSRSRSGNRTGKKGKKSPSPEL